MNFLTRSITSLAKTCTNNTIQDNFSSTTAVSPGPLTRPRIGPNGQSGFEIVRNMASLYKMHLNGPRYKVRPPRQPLDGKPFAKGVILKTLIKKPKKPNSANRKCVLVRLSTGKELVAYVPGIGHNLQEHNIVLCRVGKCQDVPGVRIKCVRGKYDLPHVIKPTK